MVPFVRRAVAAAIATLLLAGCGGAPAKRYRLDGQVLVVYPDQKRLTIKHGTTRRELDFKTLTTREGR